MNVNNIRDCAYESALNKGFFDHPVSRPEMLLLDIIGELSKEAVDALKASKFCTNSKEASFICPEEFERTTKDTFEDEITDAILRLLSLCGHMGIDINWHLYAKMNYNSTRPLLHGKINDIKVDI